MSWLRICTLAMVVLGCAGAGDARAAVVWAVGDGATDNERARAVADRIAADRPDRFLYLGDLYAGGTAEDFAQNYTPLYGRLNRITRPTPGDNEWPTRRQGYYPYWRAVRGSSIPAYYSFQLAGWQLLSLNSEAAHDARSPQLRWLRARLEARGTCRLAFFHTPPFSAGAEWDEGVKPLWRALAGHARIVLNGHDHNMQRLRRADGITPFIVGSGGRPHRSIDTSSPLLAFGNDSDDGALRLVLRRGAARFAFVRSDGNVLDSGRLRCTPLGD